MSMNIPTDNEISFHESARDWYKRISQCIKNVYFFPDINGVYK